MKAFKFIFFFVVTISLALALNQKIDQIPPLGKLLSPFHGFWQNAENERLTIPSRLEIAGLNEEVNIHFDDLLIPHIVAKNEADMFFTQGYITAFHRLWQMEFQLLSAEGRLSEVLGAAFLKYDRGQRRIGLKYGAQNSEALFKKEEPELYALLRSYSNGINAYIASLSYQDYPVEYKILDYEPEPWTPFKCFLLIANMNNMLSRGERDLEHTNALKMWGKEVFEALYPERPGTIDPVIPTDTEFDFDPIEVERPDIDFPLVFSDPIINKPHPDNGSNSFVVNGAKTANGKVILANEPDLSLNLPSIWYLVHLQAPGYNCMGATLPGGPGVVIGFNDSIAWGNTNAKRDLVDWYYIEFENNAREKYKYNNNWIAANKVVETFKVRGGDTFYDTIVYTHLGPVVYDQNYNSTRSEYQNLAMKWTAHDPTKELKALYLGNKASNYDEWVEAFSYFSGPPQNYSFASASGDIALWINGKFPVKWREQGKFLMDGSEVSQEWGPYMPQDHNLHVLNPPQNFVSSANQHAADTTYPYYQYDYSYEYYRGRRINDRLRVMNNITVEDMMALQHDNFNYNASEALPLLLDSLDTVKLSNVELSYYDKLKDWDYFSNPEREAPTVYTKWWDNLNNLLWEEIDSAEARVYRPKWYTTYLILRDQPDFAFVDNKFTPEKESSGDLIRSAFQQAVSELEAYLSEDGNTDLTWYQYKKTGITHLLRLNPFSVNDVKIGGYRHIVNAASGGHGPSWRMVVELGDGEVKAWGVYPGGQSGNPGNPSYTEMVNDWAAGNYHPLYFKSDMKVTDKEIIFSSTLSNIQ